MAKKRGKKNEFHSVDLKNKYFWMTISIVFIISIIVIITNSNYEENVTGRSTVQTISYAQSGSELHFEVRNVEGIYKATAHFNEAVKGGKILFEENANIKFDGYAYNKISVMSDDAAKIGQMEVTLKLDESKILNSGLSPYDIKLYVNDKEAKTTLTKKEYPYYYFTATANQLGEYVIGIKNEPKQEQKITGTAGNEVEDEEIIPLPVAEAATETIPPITESPAPQPKLNFFGRAIAFFQGLFN